MDKKYKVNLQCIFCGSKDFEYDINNLPKDGDMIKCSNCGQLNDYSAIRNVAVNKKLEEIKKEFHSEVQNKYNKMIKNLNKYFK